MTEQENQVNNTDSPNQKWENGFTFGFAFYNNLHLNLDKVMGFGVGISISTALLGLSFNLGYVVGTVIWYGARNIFGL